MQVRSAITADAKRISSLIRELSGSFMLSSNGKGAKPFLDSIGEPAIRSYIAAKDFSYLIAEVGSELAGVVALRDKRHLYHLFVAQAHQGKGIGRGLWLMVKESALGAGNNGDFTVNSSLNAVPVYERFGFSPIGAKVEKNGVVFLPMQWISSKDGDRVFHQADNF